MLVLAIAVAGEKSSFRNGMTVCKCMYAHDFCVFNRCSRFVVSICCYKKRPDCLFECLPEEEPNRWFETYNKIVSIVCAKKFTTMIFTGEEFQNLSLIKYLL